jgi:hypothetical protein
MAPLLLVTTPAGASSFCEIKATPDGYVALRVSPDPAARVRARMTPGDEVLLGQERRGKWVHVTYWRGGRFASGKNPAGDPATAIGWMHGDLIAKDSCGRDVSVRTARPIEGAAPNGPWSPQLTAPILSTASISALSQV